MLTLMKTLPLSQGLEALVDDCDYPLISRWKWYAIKAHNTFYAVRNNKVGPSRIWMHRAVLKPKPGFITDHINGNGLDNRRSNLRHSTPSQNMWNRRRNKINTSGHKGVYFVPVSRRWRARICVNKKPINLGVFDTIPEAAAAYAAAAKTHFSSFARPE